MSLHCVVRLGPCLNGTPRDFAWDYVKIVCAQLETAFPRSWVAAALAVGRWATGVVGAAAQVGATGGVVALARGRRGVGR